MTANKRIELERKVLTYLTKDVKDVEQDIKYNIKSIYENLKEKLPKTPQYLKNQIPTSFHDFCEDVWGPTCFLGTLGSVGLFGLVVGKAAIADHLPIQLGPTMMNAMYLTLATQLTAFGAYAGEVLSRPIPQNYNQNLNGEQKNDSQ